MQGLRPIANKLRRMAGVNAPALTDLACERWQISPAELREVPPAICLPDQVERITRTEFAPRDAVLEALEGDPARHVRATVGYQLRDVDLVDGVLYAGASEMHLRQRERSPLFKRRPQRHVSGAIYETWVGNRWFGNWLLDDCLTYRLAEETGHPVASTPQHGGHVPRYEDLLDMRPEHIGDVHFDELFLFDDQHDNAGRVARARDMRRRLMSGRNPEPNPGVFLYRGHSGDARILENEDEIAENLESQHGFRIMEPEDHSADELLDACGGARVVAGVEGSHMAHGVAAMPPGAALLTLQPPDRVTTALKSLTDRWQQRFALLIGTGTAQGFQVCWTEIQQTLALIL